MSAIPTDLPVVEALDAVVEAVTGAGCCVLQAPPGAGKTTAVPLALLERCGWTGKILMLEPRRVAARAAAERLAGLLGQKVGQDVGYRMRGDSVAGRRIEVITDGLLTRLMQADPGLEGVACVIFDEYHERALQADLALALLLDLRGALRPDLAVVVMSATLDAEPVADLLGGAPVVTSAGRMYPVETRHLDRPLGAAVSATGAGRGFVAAAAELVARAWQESAATGGDMLVFLPGAGEIRGVASALAGVGGLPEAVPLYGALPFSQQRAALAPAAPGARKLVLATAIAETSLTLPGVRVVVDAGRARRARLDPARGMQRLVTERVSRAEADQRRGRAGRTAPGICYRMWTRGEEGALPAYAPAGIETGDLAPMLLDLAIWGVTDPADLRFATQPPVGAVEAARTLLQDLGALDRSGRATAAGKAMGALPVHPRLARMLLGAGRQAVDLAALLDGADIGRGLGADLAPRLAALRGGPRPAAPRPGVDAARLAEVRRAAARLGKLVGSASGTTLSPGEMAALAYPDRIAQRRPGDAPRYLLSGGAGAELDAADTLAGAGWLVATDLDGDRRAARIRAALPLTLAEIETRFAQQIETAPVCRWDRRHRRIEARRQRRLGALVLEDLPWTDAPDAAVVPAMLDALRDLGLRKLNWTKAARGLQARAVWARAQGGDLPDLSDAALEDGLETWLAPYLAGFRRLEDLAGFDPLPALEAHLGAAALADLRRSVPLSFTAPTGSRLTIDYSGARPSISVRLQELFGLAQHPTVGPARLPLQLVLLSPGQKPVQTTSDLPGFWASSYADVRRDMRGRYPRHPWPEDPLAATPTRRVKPRAS